MADAEKKDSQGEEDIFEKINQEEAKEPEEEQPEKVLGILIPEVREKTSSDFKHKLSMVVAKTNSWFNLEICVSILSIFQIDFYVVIFVNLRFLKLNSGFGIVSFSICVGVLIFYFFVLIMQSVKFHQIISLRSHLDSKK